MTNQQPDLFLCNVAKPAPIASKLSKDSPLVVSYGGGVNSTAMLIGMIERGIIPSLVLFADTGAEKPETYAYLPLVADWLARHGVTFETVKYKVTRTNSVQWDSLEQECLERGQLPSLAYGWHKCSAKWKVKPQMQRLETWRQENGIADDVVIQKAIGFRVGEERRRKEHIQDPGTRKVFPLQEWGWDQADCLAAIARAGLPPPPKSSCYFCPATTKSEVRRLAREQPDVFARALTIERKAIAGGNLQVVKGLGRHWAWEDVVRDGPLFAESEDMTPCGCYDGGDDD